MSNFKTIRQVVQSLVFAAVPILTKACYQELFADRLTTESNIIMLIVAYVISAILIFLFNKYLNRLKCFRIYKKYEGQWIEVIPGFERQISVCSLFYKNGEYHFDGVNFARAGVKNV